MTCFKTDSAREGQTERQTERESKKGRRDERRKDKGNILAVIVCIDPERKTDGNWLFDGQKETHRSILKMAV